MQALKDIWDGLAMIGLGTVLYGCYFVWRQVQKASASAEQSQRAHEARTVVKAVEDRDDLGVEVPWAPTPNRPQK